MIQAMVRCRPRCPFIQSFRIFVFLFDQVYRVKNCDTKKGRSTADERIDGTGAAQTEQTIRGQSELGRAKRTATVFKCRCPQTW